MRWVVISAVTSASVWSGWMVSGFTTMPDFEFLDAADLGGLLGGFQVLVDDAEAAKLGHGDGHGGLGDGVHGGRDDRDVERDGAGQPGAGVGGGRQDLGVAGDQQHVVEGERLVDARGRRRRWGRGGCRMPWAGGPFRYLGGPI